MPAVRSSHTKYFHVLLYTCATAFCAGQDLKVWLSRRAGGSKEDSNPKAALVDRPNGFGSISRRQFRKPVIAAVNGLALGGGCEMVVNCDVVIAARSSKFGFPEVKRGVYAAQGQSIHSIYIHKYMDKKVE